MKNLTIKKVALGLLLAGYAASGAFAATTATTAQTIVGSAPILVKTATSAATDIGVAVALTKGPGNSGGASVPELNDTITFTFHTYDADGDKDVLTKGTTKNFRFMYKDADGTWQTVTPPTPSAINTVAVKITSAMLGATELAYSVQAETQYGAPDKGLFYYGLLDDGTNPPDTGTTAPNPPTGGIDGSTPLTPPTDGIGSTTLKAAIFEGTAGVYTAATNYSTSTTLIPKLGDTFEVKVWNDSGYDSNGDPISGAVAGEIDSGEVVYTYAASGTAEGTFTNVKWGYIGSDSAANGGGTASATYTTQQNIASATNNIFQLPATNPTSVGYAGYQGFNLSVAVDVH